MHSKPKTRLSPPGGNPKQFFTGLLLALVSICAALFILELGARLLPPPYDPGAGQFFACHPTLGWSGAPNYHGLLEDPNFQQQLTLNSLGMHDTEHPLPKPPNTRRILLLGDSFVQAVQVSESQTSHQILENHLNAQTTGPRFEVLSGGVINWGTNQQLLYYRQQGRQFEPELVLLAFYIGNDFSDNLPGNVITARGFNCYAPYFAMCGGQFNPNPLAYAPGLSGLENNCNPLRRVAIDGLGRLYRRSRLYQQLEPLLVANFPRREFGRHFPSAFSALYFPTTEVELEQARQVTLATLAQLQQEVAADGARLGVILISPEIIVRLGALSPAEQETVLKDNPILAQAQADLPNRQLAEFLQGRNIPFLDLTGPMIEHLKANPAPLYIHGEGHWTAEGNRLAAELVAGWLAQNNFLQ